MFKSICKVAVMLALTVSHAHACDLVDKRVCEIGTKLQAATGQTVQYVADFTVQTAEYEWAIGQPDIIHLGDTLRLDDDELFFVVAHEVGHSVLHHGRKFVESFGPESAKLDSDVELIQKYGAAARDGVGSAELNHSQEYEADAFAAKLMQKDGIDFAKAMKRALAPRASSALHPSRSSRIEKAREAVAAEQA